MRLLFDENLSEQLVSRLPDLFPNSLHVRPLAGSAVADAELWRLAIEQCVLVTKDEDFQRLSVWRGAPPKVIWVRLGNCSTAQVAELLRPRFEVIHAFAGNEDATFLALG